MGLQLLIAEGLQNFPLLAGLAISGGANVARPDRFVPPLFKAGTVFLQNGKALLLKLNLGSADSGLEPLPLTGGAASQLQVHVVDLPGKRGDLLVSFAQAQLLLLLQTLS